ncbi:TPA: hypothetical protein DCY43_00500 [candidate division WWE3 bacterium]|uniref:Uncharacterized protein n=1 Tax=candidate division WWE3 bacterium TaxID=2053526 RepID=A0A351JSF2_UNCKA|nr:hypothetical protein [candidate division WWE3 bacterium]
MGKLLKGSLILFVISFLGQMFIANQVSVKTKELNAMNTELAKIRSQISDINQEVFLESSLATLEKRAYALGFVKMQGALKNPAKPTIASAL